MNRSCTSRSINDQKFVDKKPQNYPFSKLNLLKNNVKKFQKLTFNMFKLSFSGYLDSTFERFFGLKIGNIF